MNTTGDNTNLADQGKDLANKAAEKIQSGLQGMTGKAQSLAKQGRDTIDTAVQQVRDTTADMSDSLLTYAKDNPGKALLMAAASGALLVALIRALTPPRD
jgi:ElaB/YqjD/DUF883 family membrane-anchored ribosome-binding protein